ncbi:ribonuclease [Clostridium estertheticum]|uniref:ribonuclease n=1 Tax=Clostridium estertheticum TaxID=238834 RepID=UPI0013EE47FC|nr:ribonuclease [Clostridium estertheticum]MBZ9607629.1 ribonuclease [Clostridium estertheticum]
MKKYLKKLCIAFVVLLVGLIGFSPQNSVIASTNINPGINSFQGVADYIHAQRKLPSNYITKTQSSKLGWRPGEDLWKYAPYKSIGGDIFTNSERVLPDAHGRVWHECDINYFGGHRGADRILYSNDGMIYGTIDHYQTFICYYDNYGSKGI